jgi:hypothetical protein
MLAALIFNGCGASYHIQTDGSQTPPQRPAQTKIAVWGTAPSVLGAATTWLQKRGVTVIERSRLTHIMSEQRTQLLHSADKEADLLKVGKLAGASALLFVEGNAIPGNASVSVRAVDIEGAQILWSGSAQYVGPLAYVDYALAGLTCEALATAWGYRTPGEHTLKAAKHCQTP